MYMVIVVLLQYRSQKHVYLPLYLKKETSTLSKYVMCYAYKRIEYKLN